MKTCEELVRGLPCGRTVYERPTYLAYETAGDLPKESRVCFDCLFDSRP